MKKILLIIISVISLNANTYVAGLVKGCENNDAKSCDQLGYTYKVGYPGTAKDIDKSVAAYKKACDLGLANGCSSVSFFYKKKDKPDGKMMAGFGEKACDLGAIYQCAFMGHVYTEGKYGLAKDYAKAEKLYEISCKKAQRALGRASACYNLGLLYKNGYLENKDPAKMAALIDQGCKANIIGACSNLRKIYADESFGLKNKTKANEAEKAESESAENFKKIGKKSLQEVKDDVDYLIKKHGDQ